MCESVTDSVENIPLPLEEEQECDLSMGDSSYSDKEVDEDDNLYQSEDGFESDVTLDEEEDGVLGLAKHRRTDLSTHMPTTVSYPGKIFEETSNALVAAGDDTYDVNSDEEQDLLKDIKDEITMMVRAEMQEELNVYESKTKAIEAGHLQSPVDNEADKYPDLADMKPELRAAYIKMRKLDKILEKRVKQEHQVKRERILLERRIRDELAELQSKAPIQREIKANTDKFMSLALPASHDEGVEVDMPSVSPVFQTQINEHDLLRTSEFKEGNPPKSTNTGTGMSGVHFTCDKETVIASSRTDNTDSLRENGSRRKSHRKKGKRNFIKRNKELAANANDTIAMTDDEKKRLQELLTDIDALPDMAEEGLDVNVDENPFQVVLQPGEGFLPTDSELRTLTSIDQRLESLLPEEEFQSISSSSVLSAAPQQRLFVRVGARVNADFESYGEHTLMETKEERELQAKLKRIEEQLATFHAAEEIKLESPALTDQQLDTLLDQCVRSLSRSLPPDTPDSMDSARSLESARARLLDNPPRLSDDVLQKLLSEAHFPLSARLLALQDDDSKSAQSGEDGQMIKADTWKAIAEEELEEESSIADDRMSSSRRPLSHNQLLAHTSHSETSVSLNSIQSYVLRSTSQMSSGRESRVSLPDISFSKFLVNTPQGQTLSCANNDPLTYRSSRHRPQPSSSLEMVYNDLSDSPVCSTTSSRLTVTSGGPSLSGTPLLLQDVGDLSEASAVPHPPQSADRQGPAKSTAKSRTGNSGPDSTI